MVLRKPYAFFIRFFKLFHVLLSILMIYSIIRIVGVIGFINDYLAANSILITQNDLESIYGFQDFLVPIIILAFDILLLTVMTMKKKPNKFYAFATLSTIILLVVNIYGYSTMKALVTVWLDVSRVSVLSDIYIFVLMICMVMCAMTISRAIGFNLSRFDFNSDILEFELSEEDNAEFEFVVDFDVNDVKRNTQKRMRYFKYFIKENKSTILTVSLVFVGILLIYGGFTYFKYSKDIKKGNSLTYNGFTFKVNDAYIINDDLKGNKLENDKYLLVIDANITNNSYREGKQFSRGTVNLSIGEYDFYSTNKYEDTIADLGELYTDQKLKLGETANKLLVFEVPKNYLKSKILLGVRNLDARKTVYIKLKTTDLTKLEDKKVEIKLGKNSNLDDSTIDGVKIKINSAEIGSKFTVNYNYCINKTKCINSTEYLVPKNNASNYDKVLLKLTGTFDFKDNSEFNSFYTLFEKFGYIEYTINGKTYTQNTMFKEVKSSKLKTTNTYYIEVLKEVSQSKEIYLGLKIRNMDYRYQLVKEQG